MFKKTSDNYNVIIFKIQILFCQNQDSRESRYSEF